MGCRDGNELNMPDSFNSTRLKPFIPNPTTSACPKTTTITPPYYGYTHNTNLVALNFHLANETKQSKIEFNEQPLGSSRWNPTPEQLLALEEMYRRGIRTPSSEQIQQIAAQLSRFGKIEGKNVFYWFQNHKARERQKRRRQMETDTEEKQHDIESPEKKESGLRRTGYEVEQTKNWVSPSNCSGLPEEFFSIHKASLADSETCEWTQFEEKELQLRKSIVERDATWQLMDLSCSPSHLINTMTTTSLDTKLSNTQNLISLLKPNTNLEDETRETQTLELFPLHSDDHDGINVTKKDIKVPITTISTNFTPNKFFEFLPLKN